MLRLRLKRLICFCLTLCLLFCSNMTVFALDEIHNTNEEEPYFNFSYKYHTNSYNYGFDSDINSITEDCKYSNFFYKDLNNPAKEMPWFNVRLFCKRDGEIIPIEETTFDDFYTSNGAPAGLHLKFDNAKDIRDNLWFVKSLSNVNSIVDDCTITLNKSDYGTFLDIIIPYNESDNAFNRSLQDYVDNNTTDTSITETSYNGYSKLCFNKLKNDGSNSGDGIYNGVNYFNTNISDNKFILDYSFDLDDSDLYSSNCIIDFDLFYIMASKGFIDVNNIYNSDYEPITQDNEPRFQLSDIHYDSNSNLFSFKYSSNDYFTSWTYIDGKEEGAYTNLSGVELDWNGSDNKFIFKFVDIMSTGIGDIPLINIAPKGYINLTYFLSSPNLLKTNLLKRGDYLYKDEVYFLNNFKATDGNHYALEEGLKVTLGYIDESGFNPIRDEFGESLNIYGDGTFSGGASIFKMDKNYIVKDITKVDKDITVTLEKTGFDITFINHYKPDETITVSKDKASNERITDSDFPENASDIFLVNNNNSGDYKKITKDEIKNLSEDTEVHYIPKSIKLPCKDGSSDSLNLLGYVDLPLIENGVTFNDDDDSLNNDSVYYSTVDIKSKEFNGVTYDEWLIENNSYNNNNHNREYTYKKFEDIQKYKAENLLEENHVNRFESAYALLPDSLGKCVDSSTVIYKGEGLKKKMDEMDKLDNFHYTCTGAELFKGNITVNKPPIGHNFQSGTPSNITNTITTQEQLTNLINNAESVKLDNQPYTNQAIDLSKVTSIIKTECGRAPEQCTSPKAYEVEIITQASTPPTPPTPPVTPPSNPHEHTWGTPKKENEKEPTCTKEGSYDLVTRCESCGAELKREHKIIEPLGHIWEDNTWTKLEKSQVNKELFNKAENASKLDFSKLKDTDDVWKRLCSRASDAYELRVVDSDLVGTVSGVLKDKNGKPIANAKVTLHSTPRTVYTNEKGEYKFEDVESGNHTLNVYVSDDSVYQGYIFISNDSTVETVDKSKDYEAIEDAKDTNVTVDINGLDSSNPSGGGDNPSDNPDDVDDPDNPNDFDDPDNPDDVDDPDNPNDFDYPDDFPGDTPEGLPSKVPEDTPTDEPDDTPDGRPHKTSDYNIWILYMMLALSIGTLITSVFRGRKKK